MNQKQKQIQRDGEERFARFVFLFLILEAGLLVFLLTAHLWPKRWTWGGTFGDPGDETGNISGELTTPEDTETQPPVTVPVFSGGVLPTRPTANGNTQVLGTEVISNYALLVDTQTGAIVASKNGNTRFSPASMTKVMTLIVACENLTEEDLERKLVLTQELHNYSHSGNYWDSSAAGFDVDDEIKIKDLLYGIGVKSASDCTAMIVFDLCGSEEAFVSLMNQKAEQMGLTNTHFDNAIGYESENNYTTATEMAMILSYALQSPLIKDILGVKSYAFEAYYYNEGVYDSYGFAYYSTLFVGRMENYQEHSNKKFSLATSTLEAGKTGALDSSFLACQAKAKNGDRYVLILGDATGSSLKLACYFTMKDVKHILDTYVP